jgi:hypothetical protein
MFGTLHPEMFAKVNPANISIVDNFSGRALRQDPSIADDASVVTNPQGLPHIVVGDQHTNPAGF